MNENCLKGLGCPNCGNTSSLRIAARCWAEVHDDGVSESYEFEWEDDAACVCPDCQYSGTVADFNVETQKHPSFSDIDVHHEVDGHRWTLTWEWIGEGNCGDYNPEDPKDEPRLRANLKVDGKAVVGCSLCTLATTRTPREDLEASAMALLLSVCENKPQPTTPPDDNEVLVPHAKFIMSEWTWKEYVSHGVRDQGSDKQGEAEEPVQQGDAGGEEGGGHDRG